MFITSPITLTVAKCWDPNPRSCFALPRSECHFCFVSFQQWFTERPVFMDVSLDLNFTYTNLLLCFWLCRWANPTHRSSCVGVTYCGYDGGIPCIWHEPFHEHSNLHQLLHQQLYPWDWTWVLSHPAAALHGLLSKSEVSFILYNAAFNLHSWCFLNEQCTVISPSFTFSTFWTPFPPPNLQKCSNISILFRCVSKSLC